MTVECEKYRDGECVLNDLIYVIGQYSYSPEHLEIMATEYPLFIYFFNYIIL